MSLKRRLGLAGADGPQNHSQCKFQFLPPSNSSWWKLSLYNWLDEKHDIWASNAGWAWQVLMGPGIPLSDSFWFSLLPILLDGICIYINWLDQKHDTWASNADWAWQVVMGPEILLSGRSKSWHISLNLLTHIKSKHMGVKYPCHQCDFKATLKGSGWDI